jgi:hypothetical protein
MKRSSTSPKGIEYIIRVVNNMPKAFMKNINSRIQLQEYLYHIYTQEQAGSNNFDKEKMKIINFIGDQLKANIDTPKGSEYILRVVSSLTNGILKTGSGIFNTLLNKLSNVMPELHLKGYKFCGPFTKLARRLLRGDEPLHKLDAGCMKHDIYYRDHEGTKERHIADKELETLAEERSLASDADVHEKNNAAFIRTVMKGKRFFGMGINY